MCMNIVVVGMKVVSRGTMVMRRHTMAMRRGTMTVAGPEEEDGKPHNFIEQKRT